MVPNRAKHHKCKFNIPKYTNPQSKPNVKVDPNHNNTSENY